MSQPPHLDDCSLNMDNYMNVEMKYSIATSSLDFTLRKDEACLKNMNQPTQVRSQLKALTDQEKGDKVDDKEDLVKLIGFNVLEEQVTEVGLQDKQ